ncbi:MAG: IPT/TIG domain-containing protein, partial [Actinobacteria bacterium]|nr:IPT/TIG domain-containing protein [Actinomycetota bacterium]
SSDIDGDTLTFGWTLASIRPSVLNAADIPLTGSGTATPTFVIPRFAQPGGIDVEWRLTVTTPRGGSGEDTVVVHIDDTVNEPPIADAGADLTGSRAVSEGTPFQLDGSASSDPNDDAITFAWELVSGLSFNGDLRETVEISGGATATPSITAALFEERSLEFRLTVTDARGLSAIDQVVVRVRQVPMQITRIAPAEGSPGTRVTIDGVNFASPATRVFFGDEDLIHQGRIESISDTRIVVVVPSGGPSRLRTFVGSAHLHGVVITDYHDVRTAPITVRTGTERVVSSQPFVVSHLEIFEAYLNQGLESYPLVQGKATVLHVRVRTAAGPQSPLPGLSPDSSGAFCTAFPAGGEPFQITPANVPPRALAPTASVTNLNQTVNFFLEPSETFFPSYRFNVLLFHNGVEVAAIRTELESSVFRETVTPRVLAVHVVPYANGSVAPTWTDAEQAAH